VSDVLSIAEAIARRAGAILKEGFGNVRQVRQKGVIDLVTEFDQRSEEVIVSALEKELPAHPSDKAAIINTLRPCCLCRRPGQSQGNRMSATGLVTGVRSTARLEYCVYAVLSA